MSLPASTLRPAVPAETAATPWWLSCLDVFAGIGLPVVALLPAAWCLVAPVVLWSSVAQSLWFAACFGLLCSIYWHEPDSLPWQSVGALLAVEVGALAGDAVLGEWWGWFLRPLGAFVAGCVLLVPVWLIYRVARWLAR